MLSLISKIGNKRLETLSTDDFLVINTLFHEQKLPDKLRQRTKRLIDIGIIEHTGRSKYVLARSLYEVIGKSGVHTRLVGLDRDRNKELILKHLEKSGVRGAPLKELHQVLPGHSRSQIQVLLRELRKENRIEKEGKTNGAKWFLV
jgi:ATP-dependent DNA helicase RecG